MVEKLKDWLNHEMKLSMTVNNISEDFQNGYLFAELLHKNGFVSDLSIYKNSKKEKDIIHNYCYLSKTFLDMNILLDEKNRNNILKKSPYTAQVYLYKIKQIIDKKFITLDALKFKKSNSIHKLYTSLMYKNDNEKYLKSREDKLESGDKNEDKTIERIKNIKKRFRRLKFSESNYKLIEKNFLDQEGIYDEARKKIFSLEKNRKENLINTENKNILNWNKSISSINQVKKRNEEDSIKRVIYFSRATLNYLKQSSKNSMTEVKKFEDNLERMGLNIPVDNKKIKKSQNINTDIIMMKMRERLNEKMKQKKDKEKRDRKKLREELEMQKIKQSQKNMNNMINNMDKYINHERSKSQFLISKNIEIKQNQRYDTIQQLFPKNDNDIIDNNNNEENNENNEDKKEEEFYKSKSSFNEISDNSKGMNLIKNSLSIHNEKILVGNRISLFQTMIENKNENENEDINIENNTSIKNKQFNSEEYFKELNKINSEALSKEIELKKKKKLKHNNLIKPIMYQILDIVNEVSKYQIENNIDLINKEKWNEITLKLVNNELIDSDLMEIMGIKKDNESEYENDYEEKINKKDEDILFDYCNYIGLFNDNIIPNEIKGYKYNYPDLYNGIYNNENGIDIKDYEPTEDEIENLILPHEKIFNNQFGQIVDISLENKYKSITQKNFIDHHFIPISENSIFNFIPIKISMLGSPLSGKKTQSKFLSEKFPHLKIYNLEEILFDFVKEYDELNIPLDQHPKIKSAKKNQVENIKLEIEKQKEEFQNIQNLIQPYLDLRNTILDESKNEEIIEEKKEEKSKNNTKGKEKENEKVEKKEEINIEIPEEVLFNILIYQVNKDFPNDIDSRYNLIKDINNKYIKYREIESKKSSIEKEIKELEENENEENTNNKKNKVNPQITNLKKELEINEKELEKMKPELYIGFILINYPKTISQANKLENYITGYISEFDKPLEEKEVKLFSYSNIIDIPIKKNSNHELIHSALDIIFNLNVENEEILRRFNGLRYDPKDNKIYHIEDNPPNSNDKKLNERLESIIPGLSENEFNEKKDFYNRNINNLSNFYNVMGNGKIRTFNNINENNKELLKKLNDEIDIIVEEVCDNYYHHIEKLIKSIEEEKEEIERKKEEELKRKEEQEKKKENEEEDDFDNISQSQFKSNNISLDLEDDKIDDNKFEENGSLTLNLNPVNELKIQMRTSPNYEMIINEIDELNYDYNKTLKNFIHFTSRQQNHIINHLNKHQNIFIQFLNRKTNKKEIAQIYLNKYNDLIKNYPELKNNPNVYRELLNDISVINVQLWTSIQIKKTEDVEKLQNFQKDGFIEKEIDFFYKYMIKVFLSEAKKYLTSVNVIKQYYFYTSSPDETEDFFVDYKEIIEGNINPNENIINKLNSIFTNSLIMIIRQDSKIKFVVEDYKNKMLTNISPINLIGIRGGNKKQTSHSNISFHSQRSGKSGKSRVKKKGKTNLINNTFNMIEEEFKNQIKTEKNKYKYRIILLKYYSIQYVKKIYKVFDDIYSNLDEFIVDSVKKQNLVLNEFIDYLKTSLNNFINYVTSSEFEFDSFDIYNKYKLNVESYFTNVKEEEEKKIEMKKYYYNIAELYSLYNTIKEYSSESINYLVKTNIVKEMLIKKYFIQNPSNLNNNAISQKIRELNFENYHFFFSLFEEYDGKYVNINELFTTLILIGSYSITNEKWKELFSENILNKDGFMKIKFWFENDNYLNKCINQEEENIIKEKGKDLKKIDYVKEIIFEINKEEGKIDMRKLEKMFKIINGEVIKNGKQKEKEIKEEYKEKEEKENNLYENKNINEDIIKESDEEESNNNSNDEEEEENEEIKKIKTKENKSDKKLMIFYLVFNINP